jgi:hypothetical protein
MALPMAQTPRYKLTIPSTNKSVTYRPFLVKEEKALLIAQQSEDPDTMIETLKSVIQSCIVDKVVVNDLAIFDVEYIFTQLRAKSVGEIVDIILKCDTCVDDKATVQYSIDLTKVKVEIPKEHTKNIILFNDVGAIMKYPTLDMIKKMESVGSDIELIFEIVCQSIESIYNSQEIFQTKEEKPEEVREFVNNLTQDQFAKLQSFFDTMPKLEERVKYMCPLCKKDHEKTIKGLESFF